MRVKADMMKLVLLALLATASAMYIPADDANPTSQLKRGANVGLGASQKRELSDDAKAKLETLLDELKKLFDKSEEKRDIVDVQEKVLSVLDKIKEYYQDNIPPKVTEAINKVKDAASKTKQVANGLLLEAMMDSYGLMVMGERVSKQVKEKIESLFGELKDFFGKSEETRDLADIKQKVIDKIKEFYNDNMPPKVAEAIKNLQQDYSDKRRLFGQLLVVLVWDTMGLIQEAGRLSQEAKEKIESKIESLMGELKEFLGTSEEKRELSDDAKAKLETLLDELKKLFDKSEEKRDLVDVQEKVLSVLDKIKEYYQDNIPPKVTEAINKVKDVASNTKQVANAVLLEAMMDSYGLMVMGERLSKQVKAKIESLFGELKEVFGKSEEKRDLGDIKQKVIDKIKEFYNDNMPPKVAEAIKNLQQEYSDGKHLFEQHLAVLVWETMGALQLAGRLSKVAKEKIESKIESLMGELKEFLGTSEEKRDLADIKPKVGSLLDKIKSHVIDIFSGETVNVQDTVSTVVDKVKEFYYFNVPIQVQEAIEKVKDIASKPGQVAQTQLTEAIYDIWALMIALSRKI